MTQQVVAQQSLLTLAKQGDAQAIATLINQVLRKKGMNAIAKRQGNCLQILLVSERVPNQDACVRFIHDGVVRLDAPSIHSIQIYGQQRHQKAPAWSQRLELHPADVIPDVVPSSISLSDLQLKPKPKKVKTKFRKRVPLIVLGSTIWVMVAALGVAVRYQLDIAMETTSKTSTSAKSPASSQSATANKTAPKSTSTLQPFIRSPQKSDSASQSTPTSQPTPIATKQPPSGLPSAPTVKIPAAFISIKAVGDIVPGTNFPNNRLPDKNLVFRNVKSSLQGADILFGNFESTLTNHPRTAKDTRRPMVHAFRTPPEYGKIFKDAGFKVLSVANNHSLDFFPAGFEDTLKNIEKLGMKPVGKKNQIVYMSVKDIPVAFIGFSHLDLHNSINNIPAAKALVTEAKKKAKIVVISFHGGAEGTGAMHVKNRQEMFYGENRGNLVLFSRTMIDNGADLVLGHGPHVPRAMELYKGKLIAYSLGNFVGYRTLSTWGPLGYSLILEAKLTPEGDFISGRIIPVQLDRRGIPYPDKQGRSIQLIRKLTQTDFPKTPLKIDSNGQISKRG